MGTIVLKSGRRMPIPGRRASLTLLAGLAAALPLAASAAAPAPDVVGQGRRLAAELAKAQYAKSRCLLAPVLADDGQTVADGNAGPFVAGDVILAVDGEPVDPADGTTLVEILERHPSNGKVEVHFTRAGAQHSVVTPCTDAKPYYDSLAAAARAAANDDSRTCAAASDTAAALHGPSSVYLRLAMSCKIKAGVLSGDAMWQADYALYRRRILEAQYTETNLEGIRHGVLNAVRDLQNNGHTELADKLRTQYQHAAAREGHDRSEPPPGPEALR